MCRSLDGSRYPGPRFFPSTMAEKVTSKELQSVLFVNRKHMSINCLSNMDCSLNRLQDDVSIDSDFFIRRSVLDWRFMV